MLVNRTTISTASLLLLLYPVEHVFSFGTSSVKQCVTKPNLLEILMDESSGKDAPPSSPGQRLKNGECILQLENLASDQECQYLCIACSDIDASPTVIETKPGLLRLPTIAAARRASATSTPCAEPLPAEVDGLLNRILLRAMLIIDEEIPSISDALFGGESLAALLAGGKEGSGCGIGLKYSSREPAINIYSSGGEFLAHKDAQALTILLPLSCPRRDFAGGGTAFWSQDSRGHRAEDPTVVSKPGAGTAMLFGGCVTHAGLPVETGTRIVFVASFSGGMSGGAPGALIEEHRDIYGDSM